MPLFVRAAGAVLLLSVAAAKAVAPAAELNSTAARLEALVRDMAEGQQGAVAAAPTPQRLAEEDVVILEGAERRRLGVCNCNGGYRNGASSGSPTCAKVENGRHVCYPQRSDGRCSDHAATACRGSGSSRPSASPAPMLFDAEAEPDEVYLNVNLQLHDAHTTSAAQLPSPDQFAHALAALTHLGRSNINVVTTWGAPVGVRAATSVAQQPTEATALAAERTTATLHATFQVRNARRREALEALLQLSEELPEIAGHSYSIVHMQVFERSQNPLVCTAQGENRKSEAQNLLRQLVELKRTEVELMRRGVQQSAGAATCDTQLLQRIAHRLGVTV